MAEGVAYVKAALALRDPTRPSRKLPRLLERRMPDPLRSWEEWRRFIGDDLADATPAQRRRERTQLAVAAALVDDPDRVPTWVLRRLEVLAS